jgi:hypothetical protein
MDSSPSSRKRRKLEDGEGNNRRAGGKDNAQRDDKVHEIMSESSDLTSSEEKGETSNPNGSASDVAGDIAHMRAQWDRLLDERQEINSNDGVSEWLDRVVATSERYKAASRKAFLNNQG